MRFVEGGSMGMDTAFSSRVLAQSDMVEEVIASRIPDAEITVCKSGIIYATVKTAMADASVDIGEISKNSEQAVTPIIPTPLYGSATVQQPLEYQRLENDPEWEYVELGPIPEKIEWLGVKKDGNGKPLRNISASVVGKVRQSETVIHPGNVTENMVRIFTYARWDPNNPNPDLRELGELIRGATGPEIKIEQLVQPIVANGHGMEYSGIRKRRVAPLVGEKPQPISVEEQVA